jgi:predicted nucleic acid-binding protein
MKYLLDTDICIFAIKGELRLREFECCAILMATVLELRCGAEFSKNPLREHRLITAFLEGVPSLFMDVCVNTFAKEKAKHRRLGLSFRNDFDFIIGATAVERSLIPVTHNTKDFMHFDKIQLEDWMIN